MRNGVNQMLLPRFESLDNVVELRSVTDKKPVVFLQFLEGSLGRYEIHVRSKVTIPTADD